MVSRKAVYIVLLICLLSLLSACGRASTPPNVSVSASEPASSSQGETPSEPLSSVAEPAPTAPKTPSSDSGASQAPAAPKQNGNTISDSTYLNALITDTIAKFATPKMSEYERTKAAFDYMIANTVLDEPIGLERWRLHDDVTKQLSFVENRALSVLQYGVGMCEDYAAAFTMLLRGLGLEAEYVPGLTYSLEGHLVDHAWTIAKIDGVWYHLDYQLEDNISRRNTIRYRYFMKSDATMASSHRWGQTLINSALLLPEQNAEIAQSFLGKPCPQNYPTPAPYTFTAPPAPDIAALKSESEAEILVYETQNGALPPLELDIIPPVFGLVGYGPQDEG